MNTTITAVFFDATGTLLRVKHSVGEVYLAYAQDFGVASAPGRADAINRGFKAVFARTPAPTYTGEGPAAARLCERRWWHQLVRDVFAHAGLLSDLGNAFDAYFDRVYDGFAEGRHWTLFPDAAPTLAALRERGYCLAIVSNFDARLYRIADELGLTALVDSITLSGEVGNAKPHGTIYRKALARHDLAPEQVLHVGDDPDSDAAGAHEAGIHPVLLDREGQHTDFQGPTVCRLTDLLDRLPPL